MQAHIWNLKRLKNKIRGRCIDTGDVLDQGTAYLKALAWLWGIGLVQIVSAQNMDYVSNDKIEEKISAAVNQGLEIVKDF